MTTHFLPSLRFVVGWCAALALAPAFAGGADKAPSPEARYQQERAACMSGASHQARDTCLKEAGAALAEARRGRLDNGEQSQRLMNNALQRCKVVPTADRTECERLARGEGTVSGTVEGGGVIKELITTVPAPAPAPVPQR